MVSPDTPRPDGTATADTAFLDGGGEMGARIRAFDWASHPFGVPGSWPQTLRMAIRLCLHSAFPTAIYWGPELRLLYNDAWSAIPADRHPWALGRAGAEVWSDIWNVVGPQFDAVLTSGEGFSAYDQRLAMVRSGVVTETYWNYSFSPLFDDDGSVCGILNQGNETTAKVLGEAALRHAKEERDFILTLAEQQRAQTDADNVMQMTAEVVGTYLGTNRAGFFRVSEESIITFGACWVDGVLPPLSGSIPSAVFGASLGDTVRSGQTLAFGGSADGLRPDDRALDATGTQAGISVPLVRDGRWEAGFYLSHATPRQWTRAEIALVEEIAQLSWDAVARARAVTSLRAMNANLAGEIAKRTAERDRIWDVSQDMLGVAAQDGTWLTVNPAWERLLGWPTSELVGRTSEWLTHPDDNERTRREVLNRSEGDRSIGFENRFRTRAGGWKTLSWTAVLSDGRIYATAQDVTEQRELQERLRQSQKMEAVGQLTGGLAHDFNNLLTGMSGAMEMMQVRLKQGRVNELDRYITAAQAASGRAAALTHRLLAFSRRQTLDPRPTDANRLIADMEDMIRRTVGPSVVVEVIGADALWAALVDPNQLENALLNLCINARDAMPDGGNLKIDTANIELDEADAAERDLPPGNYLTVCVTDTGTGMTPDVAARAFDPFFTTKPIGMGTGLGLSMIYGFARQSGGHVRIESEVGKGTLICLYLPRHYGAVAAAPRPAIPRIEPLVASGETVLVVDDEPSVRMLVTDILDELGFVAIEAAEGAGALTVLRSDARIDLLVTDVGLPGGLNGRQVADAARAVRPNLPVLFITGHAEHAVIGNGPLDEGMAIITKPFSIDVLTNRIRDMVEVTHAASNGRIVS